MKWHNTNILCRKCWSHRKDHLLYIDLFLFEFTKQKLFLEFPENTRNYKYIWSNKWWMQLLILFLVGIGVGLAWFWMHSALTLFYITQKHPTKPKYFVCIVDILFYIFLSVVPINKYAYIYESIRYWVFYLYLSSIKTFYDIFWYVMEIYNP